MGKGNPRAVEKGVLGGQNSGTPSSSSLNVPPAPVYYPSEEEFKDPLEFINKIRAEAEPYGICRIVPPSSWKPPFALDLDRFTFPTKTQAIHQLQVRPPSCDPKTFHLEYKRFLEDVVGKKLRGRVVFEGVDLDLCKLFNGVKRYGGYDKVVEEKKWGEVFKFLCLRKKISACSKHVLCQLYREHLYDYEIYYNKLNQGVTRGCKRGLEGGDNVDRVFESSIFKRRRRSHGGGASSCRVDREEEHDQICEQCQSGLHGEVMLLCDRCNKGWHMYCLSPPLKRVPPGNWYCFECLNSDKDSFGFVPGKQFSLEAFRRIADRAKKKWFRTAPTSRIQLEKKFWEIVEGTVGEVEVMYGSDIDTSVYGSGFPRANNQRLESVEAGSWEEYCASPWNLNNLPKLKGSMLRAVHNGIAGVMVPWLYVGMVFSSFCWHFEDHCFYSMNYMHWGEPKCWYSVPGKEAGAFEKVMKSSLPDLFDAQPDLLFQLVTMLNPSVLQENGVPVYSVLQEPGNFVITFPRSYHAGFNFGLNCAEAVNFAPADWLPHGGFGAELYRLYHKAAVLSHEELLCVVAKTDSASNVSPFLKKELSRIYAKERSWRERLWRLGISKSSPMSPREHPDYVGTEEDPTCIICQQNLYLSAVVCRCRSSAFVCLEHWEHLCECTPSKRRLLYRHTLAELNDIALMEDLSSLKEIPQHRSSKQQLLSSDEASSVTKKVNGVSVTLTQLAEDWLLSCCKIFQTPYSRGSFRKALKQAEQFLWAGSEMDPVRDIAKNIVDAQNWAEGIRDCLSKIESWSKNCDSDAEKVSMEHVNNLLSLKHVSCNEPRIILLKDYAEKAMALYEEIDCALAKSSKITELELLQSRACDLALHLSNVEKLNQKISSTEAWVSNLRKYISDESNTVIEVDVLHKLKSEILKLQVEVPEVEMLDNLIRLAESCQARCNEIMNGPMVIKTVENLLQELGSCSINLLELKLLKQYYSDAISWTSRFTDLLINIHGREDQENVVHELECLLKEGESLKIQVDEVPSVEIELRKACCRVKAWKARESKVSLDHLHHIVAEAAELQIAEENLFVNISGVLECALRWEDKAKHVLIGKAQMSEFEDVMRDSVDICAILPSLEAVEAAVSMATVWLKNSEPYLKSSCNAGSSSSFGLKIERLEELILQSDSLKISLEEQARLRVILESCKEWEVNARSLIEDFNRLFNFDNIGNTDDLIVEIQSLLARIVSAIDAGFSLGFKFIEVSELQEASSVLQWCCRALSLCTVVPQLEEVKHLVGLAEQLPLKWSSSPLCNSLVDGTKWLKTAVEVFSSSGKRSTLSNVQSILAEIQTIKLAFPLMISQLLNATKNHELWLEQVHLYFKPMSGKRSWSQIMKLKDLGDTDAFSCPELDMVVFEVDKVEKWKKKCNRIMRLPVNDSNSLLISLMKIRDALDRVLGVFGKSRCSEIPCLCMWCSNDFEDQKFLTCSICNDWYHLSCVEPIPTYAKDNRTLSYACLYCQFIESGSVSWSRGSCMSVRGKRPDVKILFDLVSECKDFAVWIEESGILEEVVEKALQWQACLKGILDYTLTNVDKDLIVVKEKLTIALKAVEVSGLFDHQNYCNLDAALARNAWRIRVEKLLGSSQKPSIQQIQRHLKEGLAIMIPPEDHYSKKLNELKHIGMQWIDIAKKVAGDSGSLGLDEVFDLIMEGERLPVQVEKELKLLKTRSMLYCICRKPYDQRAMIACDQCDEWYHFDCIKLSFTPKVYICPACAPQSELHLEPLLDHQDELSDTKFGGPKTPSPHHQEPRRRRKTMQFILQHNVSSVPFSDNKNRGSSGIDQLLWRNKKPFSRGARKRTDLSSFCNVQMTN